MIACPPGDPRRSGQDPSCEALAGCRRSVARCSGGVRVQDRWSAERRPGATRIGCAAACARQAGSFGIRARLKAARARWKPCWVRSRPRNRDFPQPATALSQPDISSMRLRTRWLTAWPGWRLVRPSMSERRRALTVSYAPCATCGMTLRSHNSATTPAVSNPLSRASVPPGRGWSRTIPPPKPHRNQDALRETAGPTSGRSGFRAPGCQVPGPRGGRNGFSARGLPDTGTVGSACPGNGEPLPSPDLCSRALAWRRRGRFGSAFSPLSCGSVHWQGSTATAFPCRFRVS